MVRKVPVTALRENLPPTMLDLPGGRRLAYHEYGDPSGAVIVNCHGGLVSGIDVEYSDGPARELGLRIISPNRPGIGGTSRQPAHRMLDWARTDLTTLLDSLAVDRFSVLGWSEGGQYALAVAHEFAARVDRVAVVAGALPLADPEPSRLGPPSGRDGGGSAGGVPGGGATTAAVPRGGGGGWVPRGGGGGWVPRGGGGAVPGGGVADRLQELNANDRRLVKLARHAPVLARAYFLSSRITARVSPPLLARMASITLSETDAALITTYSNWFARALAESAFDTRGSVDEYLAFGSPWGFTPEQVTAPVDVFQGTADLVIPAAWSRELVRRLPNAALHEYEGQGHFIALTRRAEVLEHLAAPLHTG